MLVQTREQFVHARTVLLDSELTAMDTETIGFGKLFGISTYCAIRGREPFEASFYFPFRHSHNRELFKGVENLPIEWLEELRPVIERPDAEWIFHNFKYDLQVFWRDGLDIKSDKVYDTMLLSWMIDENTPNDLDAVGERLLGEKKVGGIKEVAAKLGGKDDWSVVPPDAAAHYAEQDAKLTYNIFPKLKQLAEGQEQWELLPLEIQFARCLAELEFRGVRVDVERCKQLAVETDEHLQAMRERLGFDPAKPRQLAHKLFDRSECGLMPPAGLSKRKCSPAITLSNGVQIENIPGMDKAALRKLSHPVVADVLHYRGKKHALSTWFEPLPPKVDPSGRVHTLFKQHGTVTTRLSAANPPLHQIPRTTEEERDQGISVGIVKSLFLPDDECELWEFDYSQAEYRLAGCYSKEPEIIEGYNSGVDFHSLTAQKLGIPRQEPAGGKKDAKNVNFAMLYSAGPARLAEMLETDPATGAALHAEFKASYPLLMQTIDGATRAAKRGWVRHWDGRRRHFQYPSEHYKAFNSVIQGGVARIVIRTMIKLRDDPRVKSVMHLQVHDAIWLSVPKSEVESQIEIIREIMEWPTGEFPIPFTVDAKRLDNDDS